MCVVVAWCFGVPLAASSAPRPWVPQDSLSVRYVSLHPYSPTAWFLGERAQPQAVTPSPDGKYFFFLTYRGEMASDSTVVELHVYSVEQIRSWLRVVEAERTAAPEPYRRVALRSHSSSESEPAIRGVQWEPNGKGILFAGMTAEGLMQIHRLDVSSGRLDQLTFRPDGVAEFHARGESLLFKSEVAKRTPDEYRYPVTTFRRTTTWGLRPEFHQTEETVYAIYGGGEPRSLGRDYGSAFYRQEWMSPDGRFAVGMYWGPKPQGTRYRPLRAVDRQQFVFVDLEKAEFLPFAPRFGGQAVPYTNTYINPEVFWSGDSTRAILTAAVPKESGIPSHGQTSYIVEYDV